MYMKDLLSPIIEKFDSVVSKVTILASCDFFQLVIVVNHYSWYFISFQLMSETNDASSLMFAQQLYHLVAYAR